MTRTTSIYVCADDTRGEAAEDAQETEPDRLTLDTCPQEISPTRRAEETAVMKGTEAPQGACPMLVQQESLRAEPWRQLE